MVSHIVRHESLLSHEQRSELLQQHGAVLWFTGFSGAGKSTVAHALELRLVSGGTLAYVLDGDNVRHGLNGDLGFSPEDRSENIRRIGEVAALFCDASIITLVSFISPFRQDRALAREKAPAGRFIEVYVDAPLAVCEQRDPKGLYVKARAGDIPEFTGISSPYEPPENPEIHLPTAEMSVDRCVDTVLAYLIRDGIVSAARHGEAC